MSEVNYFELLKISSDAKTKDIQEAIEKFNDGIKAKQNNKQISDEELKEALETIKKMREWVQNKDSVNRTREEFIKKQTDALIAYFKALPKNYEIYKRELESWIQRYRLTDNEIQKIMENNPYNKIKLVKVNALPADFIFTNFKKYIETIETISTMPELAKIWSWTNKVHDLYDILAFASNESKMTIIQMDNTEIHKLIDLNKEPMIKKAGGGAGVTSLPLRTAFSQMDTVFNVSKPNVRQQYDNSLKYYSELKDVINVIKQTPLEMRKDDKFVNNILAQIKKVFDDDTIALGIYNKEAGLLNDPYEPPKVVITMRCSSCGTINKFETREKAKVGCCEACGLKFYKGCPSCNKQIPTSSLICPECNFNLFEFQKTLKYFNNAKAALLKNNYSEAYSYLIQAENADPNKLELNKISEYIEIKNKINKVYEDFKVFLKTLETYIASKQFMHARDEAEQVKIKNPSIDLTTQLKVINEAISKAQSLMPSINELNENTVQRCYDVLDIVADYLPANELIRKVPVQPVNNLIISGINGNELGVNISYKPSKSIRVSYYVVRNEQHIPKSYADGEVIVADSDKLVVEDHKLTCGKKYYYSVFCCREGLFSTGVADSFSAYLDVDKINNKIEGAKISLSFSLPQNSIGTRIYRKENGIPLSEKDSSIVLKNDNCQGIFEDIDVQYDHQYGYLIQTCYLENNQKVYTKGIGIILKVERDPIDLKNVTLVKDGSMFKVSFDIEDQTANNTVSIFTINPNIIGNKLHQLLPIEEINNLIKNQKMIATGKSLEKQINFSLTGNFSYDIAVISLNDAKGIISFIGKISSIELVEIDKGKSEIKEGNKAYIRLKTIPQLLVGIHYLPLDISSQKNSITQEDINRHISYYMRTDEYRKEGLICVSSRVISNGKFKMLLVGEYLIENKTVFSDTSVTEISIKQNTEIKYYIEWKKQGLFKKKYNGKLMIKTNDTIEELVLMAKDGVAPLSISDINADKVFEIENVKEMKKISNDTYEMEIPENECYNNRVYRLFSKKSMVKITSSDYNSLKYPK